MNRGFIADAKVRKVGKVRKTGALLTHKRGRARRSEKRKRKRKRDLVHGIKMIRDWDGLLVSRFVGDNGGGVLAVREVKRTANEWVGMSCL